ncbi:MAG: heparinase II/III family protein [Planctomycetes bacterium]|nr:heparinase II/III family protein [Planctomycetota bacterium]
MLKKLVAVSAWLLVAILAAGNAVVAADFPRPGLEIFDSGSAPTPGQQQPGQGQQPQPAQPAQPQQQYQQQPDLQSNQTQAPVSRLDSYDPYADPYSVGPYAPSTTTPPQADQTPRPDGYVAVPDIDTDQTVDPYLGDPEPLGSSPGADPYAVDPYTGQPYPADPNAPVQPGVPADPTAQLGQQVLEAPVQMAESADPVGDTIFDLNEFNPQYPGLGQAKAQGNLRMASDIILNVLRQRRIVNATLQRGPRGSVGQVDAYELEQAMLAMNHRGPNSANPNSLLAASDRIDTILASFDKPVIDDINYANLFEVGLVRLHTDLVDILTCMDSLQNDIVYQRLIGSYMRAATVCDFFIFPREVMGRSLDVAVTRWSELFYPDGSSIAGDTGGISGNVILNQMNLEYNYANEPWFRRNLRFSANRLEMPARHLVGVAMPDKTLPLFGPRGARELNYNEISALEAMYPPALTRMQRIGLAASDSYPNLSNAANYGGIYAMRSSLDPSARYMAIKFGPVACLPGAPQHFDFGSFSLMFNGVRFIVDAGGFDGVVAGPSAHNVLSLNNMFVVPDSYNQPGQPVRSIWRTNASLDYVTDAASFEDGKSWQRSAIYVKNLPGEAKNDYWLLLDHVNMMNDSRPHQVRIRFNLAPGIQTYNDGAGMVASAGYGTGASLRFYPIEPNAQLMSTDGAFTGGGYGGQGVVLARNITGDTTTATLLYPSENFSDRPARLDRDSDIIRGRTGAIIIDHGNDRIDVVAWSPPGQELVTPTLNLQMSADLAVFRIRKGKIVRINFVNLERFQAKEPEGGMWSMRVAGNPQTLTIEPEAHGGWQVLSDPANAGVATLFDASFGPAITNRRFSIKPGDMRVVVR